MDEQALLQALQSGHVAAAGLDVFEQEPPTNTALIQHDRVVCTPHLGASTKEAQNNVAKEIALQFLDIVDGKSVPGVVNAPLLSETLKHENLIWILLGRSLGKLVATNQQATLKSFQVAIKGTAASKQAKLIKESVLLGVLSILTNSPSVSIIAAPSLAASLGIDSSFTVEDGPCCTSTVTVKTNNGSTFTGRAQGFRAYLTSVNGHHFEPSVAFQNTLTLFQVDPSVSQAQVLSTLANLTNLESITKAKDNETLWAVHSHGELGSLASIKPVYINQVSF